MSLMGIPDDQPGNENGAAMLVDFDQYEFLRHGGIFYIINNRNAIMMPKKGL